MAVHNPDFSYYQIGGFRPNVALQGGLQYDMRKLAEAIVDPESTVDLVLGIRPSGASAILIPTSEWIKNEAFRYPGTPHLAADFLSLSPLQFNSALQLNKKLLPQAKMQEARRGRQCRKQTLSWKCWTVRPVPFRVRAQPIIIPCLQTLLQVLEVRSQQVLSVGLCASHFARFQRVVSRESFRSPGNRRKTTLW
ncbi:hypothetical protein BJV77DRAFT_131351 [Russula vinacea]|nr:hypothetical protein BJV77DRAFT_131351 [Russula vinacea]